MHETIALHAITRTSSPSKVSHPLRRHGVCNVLYVYIINIFISIILQETENEMLGPSRLRFFQILSITR